MSSILRALTLITILFSTLELHSKEVMCRYLFHTDDRLSRAVREFQKGKTDTTSLRQEVKFVVKTTQINDYISRMEQVFGERIKNRDRAPEGYANITSTRYMTVGKFIQNGKRLSAKVRFRKYYTRKIEDTQWRNLEPLESLVDRSWLELKIQHPEFDNVVFKPRLVVYDKDIQKIITEKFLDYQDGVVARLRELNPGKESDIQKFVNYFIALYTTPAMRAENMFAKTEYERTSYSIKLKNPNNPSEAIDIQVTLDQGIRLTRLKDNSTFNVYKDNETVVEVKIPLQFSKLTEQNLHDVPELIEIKKLIEYLDSHHVMDYPKNKGKMSKIDKKNDMQDDKDLETDDYD